MSSEIPSLAPLSISPNPVPAPPSASVADVSAAPDFCREDASALRWIDEHTPDARPVQQEHIDQAHGLASSSESSATVSSLSAAKPVHTGEKKLVRRNGDLPVVNKRVYNADEEVKTREDLVSSVSATSASSPDELQRLLALEEDHTVQYTRTLVCNAPKALLWRALMSKIRTAPDCSPCGMVNIKIACEGPDYVFRELDVDAINGPPGAKQHVKEKITWSEEDENVRFTLYEDETKEGYIESGISVDASASLCLTVSCNWIFHPSDSLTPELMSQWRSRMKQALDAACASTVRAVELEAKAVAQERRRRHSLTQGKEAELAAHLAAAEKEKQDKEKHEKKQADTHPHAQHTPPIATAKVTDSK